MAAIQRRDGARGEELVVPFDKRNALVFFLCWLAVGIVPVAVMLFLVPGEWLLWFAIAVLGLAPLFVFRRWGTRGLLSKTPLLVLDPQGLQDTMSGNRIEWEEVERIQVRESTRRGEAKHSLVVTYRRSESPLEISLDFAAPSVDEIVGAVRRFWQRPVERAA